MNNNKFIFILEKKRRRRRGSCCIKHLTILTQTHGRPHFTGAGPHAPQQASNRSIINTELDCGAAEAPDEMAAPAGLVLCRKSYQESHPSQTSSLSLLEISIKVVIEEN